MHASRRRNAHPSYRILAPLGVGGMGEVYPPIDSRLHREVAAKIVPLDAATALATRIDAVAASPKIGIQGLKFTADRKGHVYSDYRSDGELYLVDGLK